MIAWHRNTFIITGPSWENPCIRCWCDDTGKFLHNWPLCRESTSQCWHSSHKGPVMQRWWLLGAVSLNKLFNKQASCWWFETTWCCDIITKFISMIRSIFHITDHQSVRTQEAIIYIGFAAQMLTWGTLTPNSAGHYFPVFYLTTHPPIPDGKIMLRTGKKFWYHIRIVCVVVWISSKRINIMAAQVKKSNEKNQWFF